MLKLSMQCSEQCCLAIADSACRRLHRPLQWPAGEHAANIAHLPCTISHLQISAVLPCAGWLLSRTGCADGAQAGWHEDL